VLASDPVQQQQQQQQHRAGFSSKPFTYKRSTLASIKVEDDCNCLMGNWVLEGGGGTGGGGGGASPTPAARLEGRFGGGNPRAEKARGMSFS
jgi:hypothetical protein